MIWYFFKVSEDLTQLLKAITVWEFYLTSGINCGIVNNQQ